MCACMCVGAGIHSGTNACVRACVALGWGLGVFLDHTPLYCFILRGRVSRLKRSLQMQISLTSQLFQRWPSLALFLNTGTLESQVGLQGFGGFELQSQRELALVCKPCIYSPVRSSPWDFLTVVEENRLNLPSDGKYAVQSWAVAMA